MKRGGVEKALCVILITILAGIVMHAPFSVFFGSQFPAADLLLKAWKELLMVLGFVLAGIMVTRHKMWPRVLGDWVIYACGIYALIHLFTAFILPTSIEQTVAGLMIDLRYVAYFVLVYVLLKTAPAYRTVFVKTAVIGAVVVIGFGFLQLFLPHDILKHIGYDKRTTIAPYLTVDQNYDYIRINSTLRGPNPLGAYAVIVLAGLAAAIAHNKLSLNTRRQWLLSSAAIAMTTAVLWVSYSRSALGAAILALGIIGLLAIPTKWFKKYGIYIVIALLVGFGGLFAARSTDFVSHVILHEDPSEGNAVNSNDGHIESLAMGMERMIAKPFGAGVGSTGSASLLGTEPLIIENQYLFIAHEIGWLGLGVFLTLFVLVLYRLWRQRDDWLALGLLASGVGLAAIGMLLPVWADDTVSIVWWGLAAVALTTPRKEKK